MVSCQVILLVGICFKERLQFFQALAAGNNKSARPGHFGAGDEKNILIVTGLKKSPMFIDDWIQLIGGHQVLDFTQKIFH